MKNFFSKWGPALGSLVLLIGLFAFSAQQEAEHRGLAFDSPPAAGELLPTMYRPTRTVDTITNAESDTITLPVRLYTAFSYNWTIATDSINGTNGGTLTVTLQESASDSGTDWITVGSPLSMSGALDLDRATGALIYGVRQRLIVTGTGTQNTAYVVYPVFKYGQY